MRLSYLTGFGQHEHFCFFYEPNIFRTPLFSGAHTTFRRQQSLFLFLSLTQYIFSINAFWSRFGPIVRLQLGAPTVLIYDPKDMEQMFSNEGRYPRRPTFSLTLTYNVRNGVKDSLADTYVWAPIFLIYLPNIKNLQPRQAFRCNSTPLVSS